MRIPFKRPLVTLLVVLAAGCSGLASPDDRAGTPDAGDSMPPGDDEPGDDPPPPPAEACVVAGQTYADGSSVPSGDRCTRCDCNDGSVSCVATPCEPVGCDPDVETPDDVCSRQPLDPCIFQDPDCSTGTVGAACETAGQSFPDGSDVPSGDRCNTCSCDEGSVSCTEIACEPSICADFVEASDGVCSRFPLDPCIAQDPDCGSGGAISCEVAGQSFPDGSDVPSGDDCNTCSCSVGSVSCTEAACEPVFCAEFIEQPDGACSRFPLDPCIFQDPDCGGGAGSCEAAGQSFPDGSEIPSGDSCNTCGCSAGSISCTEIACEPVGCDEFLEASDGVCSRFPLDPCPFQDPDCTSEPTPPQP